MRKHGFTLIELMIVVAIIAIIAAIAIPNLLRSKMSANEASAASSMRLISTSEVAFQTAAFRDTNTDGTGDFGDLAALAGTTPPFIDNVLGSGTKQGYAFAAVPVDGTAAAPPTYTATGTPLGANQGSRNYFVDESGVVRVAQGAAATVASPPLG